MQRRHCCAVATVDPSGTVLHLCYGRGEGTNAAEQPETTSKYPMD